MRPNSFIWRYLVAIALWGWVLYFNYSRAKRSVLPIGDALWLPNMVLPGALMVLAAGFLWVALTVKPRTDLLDAQASVAVRAPRVVWAARFVFSAALIATGFAALTSPARADLAYSTPAWGLFWIAMGAWALADTARLPRRWVEVLPSGIRHPQVRPSQIPWEDVAEVKLQRWLLAAFVVVRFREGANYHFAAPLWRWRRVRRIRLLPLFFGVDAATLANALNMRRDVRAF